MELQEQWTRLLQAARSPVASARDGQLMDRALAVGMTVADGMLGCSITEVVPEGGRTPAASNDLALSLDMVQYEARSGPCVQAAVERRSQQVVMGHAAVGHPAGEHAAFVEAALAAGVRSSLSVPLVGADWPSALNLYASEPAAFESARTRAVADLLAQCAALLLTAATRADEDEELASARSLGRKVQLAQRNLSRQLGVSATDAYSRLAELSCQRGTSIVSVARELLEEQEHADTEADEAHS